MACFSNLPNELVAMLLGALHDIESLKNSVVTSKRVYEIYSGCRTQILSSILYRLLHEELRILPEIHMSLLAYDLDLSRADVWDDIIMILHAGKVKLAECLSRDQTFQKPERTFFLVDTRSKTYESRVIVRKRPSSSWNVSLHEFGRIYRIYGTVDLAVKKFCERALPAQAACDKLELSITEKQRLYRAFLRIDFYHRLLGPPGQDWPMSYFERPWTWLCMFPPHELDEMNCAMDFLNECWERVICHARAEPDIPEPYEIDMRIGLVGVILSGLKRFLWDQELESVDPAEVRKFLASIPLVDEIGLTEVLCDLKWARDQYGITSKEDGCPDPGDRVEFTSDHVNCPNAAWVKTLIDGKMTNAYCAITKTDQLVGMDCSGWALWDLERLHLWPQLWNRLGPIEVTGQRSRTEL